MGTSAWTSLALSFHLGGRPNLPIRNSSSTRHVLDVAIFALTTFSVAFRKFKAAEGN
ncbi:uncharacterized protein PHALS_03662 [Plasmopara halstedii]|uniref:Uncharacterized protein n=1 Tax=Plasmopara halstedii TaxID=4781 RepID=A0A0P1AX54_PLAHL|nr:uncharacterized protein PHALS_03662 [Plasmopara halstedii]CEG46996.1 hypothetical protein PHALS_03662 [Plasmopara halstedii]|eukprot:XP_024583365.1 hypothetical protein PHALS_03662 [Plasmopara halstedii]